MVDLRIIRHVVGRRPAGQSGHIRRRHSPPDHLARHQRHPLNPTAENPVTRHRVVALAVVPHRGRLLGLKHFPPVKHGPSDRILRRYRAHCDRQAEWAGRRGRWVFRQLEH